MKLNILVIEVVDLAMKLFVLALRLVDLVVEVWDDLVMKLVDRVVS